VVLYYPATAAPLARLLSLDGHEVQLAHDGLSALRAAERHPDVVLPDIGLPGMSGYQQAQRLRGQGRVGGVLPQALPEVVEGGAQRGQPLLVVLR
jgi:CheY-like chemotaxis protein